MCVKMSKDQPKCHECDALDGTFRCGLCFWARYCCKEHQKKHWKFHKKQCFSIPVEMIKDEGNLLFQEAFKLSLFAEYKALESKTGLNLPLAEGDSRVADFHGARYYLFKGLIGMILYDPVKGEKGVKMSEEDVKAWKFFEKNVLMGFYWMDALKPGSMWIEDALHWTFIPPSLHKEVERICKTDLVKPEVVVVTDK